MRAMKLTAIVFAITFLLLFQVRGGAGSNNTVEPDSSGEASCEEENGPDVNAIGKIKKRNPAHYVSIEVVLNRLKDNEDVVLIDVRNEEDFERLRIPGAIHIPLYAIKTKGFLKTRHLVLVNEGYHSSPLEEECQRLRESGFTSVSILDGGLSAWSRAKAQVEGGLSVLKDIRRIRPRDFFLERDYEEWIVAYISNAPESDAYSLFPRVVPVPDSEGPGKFLSAWRRAAGTQSNPSLYSTLILTDNGEGYDRIEGWVEQEGIKKAFYLEGGLEGYKRFQKEQALIRPLQKTTGKGVEKCGNPR